MEYHVSKTGKDTNKGTKDSPFLTISKAAKVMIAGDCVYVHEGVYREWVKPENSGASNSNRITYKAYENDHVELKGSEIIKGWEKYKDNTWKVTISNDFFGDYNPYETTIEGDWLLLPHNPCVHTGDVYLNGQSFYEAFSIEEVCEGKVRTQGQTNPWTYREEYIPNPENTIYKWFATVDEENTTIYAYFGDFDPNEETVEINVREYVFFPTVYGRNYITVSGFEMSQCASKWAPPTSFQTGLLGTYWSKGWIIENNHIHDAKCSAICLGKEETTGDNDCTKFGNKPGYQTQLEAVFKARALGWNFDTVGSHIVRNNIIHDCGQNGVVGHLGCIGSEIYGNEIYNIGMKHEYFGWEIGGIKLHASLDVFIHNNYIHDCLLGTWLDWQAQGVRVSSNIYKNNIRGLMVEVSHGPYVVDNNIFDDEFTFENASQGGAFVHNLAGGFTVRYTVLNRSTPYHYPHSTRVLGTALVYGCDDHVAMNLFAGGKEAEKYSDKHSYGTSHYNGATLSMEEYITKVRDMGYGDVEQYEQVMQPVYVWNNVYYNGAASFEREENVLREKELAYKITDDGKDVYIDIELSKDALKVKDDIISSKTLGETRISQARFENPDGSDMYIDKDFLGNKRNDKTLVGPFEDLKEGNNRILIWSR